MRTQRSIFNWITTAVFLALFLPIGRGEAQADASAPANILAKSGQKVVFMGDSITGMGWSDTGGYIHLVVSGLGTLGVQITPIPAGVGGNKSDDMLARLDKDALSQKPDWLLLSCGVNDVWSRRIDLDTFKKNITAIVDQAQAAGIKVMILTPTPIYEMADTEFSRNEAGYVAFMVQLAHDRKLPLADENAAYFEYLKTQSPDPINNILTIDGVHPNPDGHQVLAQTVIKAFGATPDQMAKVEAAWRALPDGANLPFGFGVDAKVTITAAQNAALEKLAADRKAPMENIERGLFMVAIRDVLVAHHDLFSLDENGLARAVEPLVKQEVEKLSPTPPGTASAASDVQLVPNFGFRDGGTVHISIPQYETFKKLALQKKITKHQLTLSLFLEAIRDTLIAHGDVSNIHQDNISHDSWPLYEKYVADAVK